MRRSRGRSDDARAKRRAPLTLRHPLRALAVAAVLIAALVSFGFSLEQRLSPSTIDIEGTSADRANRMLSKYFGESAPFVVFLQGPPGAIDRQGPELVRKLRRDPKVTTLSPWDRGSVGQLRPKPRHAFILVDFHVGSNAAVDDKVPLLDDLLADEIHPPVRATQTGFATLSRSIEDESISSTERAELIALPILLIVLLLVFRSPVAAAVPLGFGAISVFTSRGLLSILTNFFEVSALALVVCSMMGLALGVDYALLLVSRFREELAKGADPVEAAWETRRTAGRTVVFAGSTLVLSMVVALFVVPGALLASLAGTLALVVVLTVIVATLLGPPVLVLAGTNIDRWRIGPAPNGERSRLMTVVAAALKRPIPVSVAIGALLLVLAAPAIALKTGPFSIGQLPKDNQAREDAELIQASAGGGFEAPFAIVAATPSGTITEPERLDVLRRWQRRIAKTPGVQSVIGPGQVARRVEPLRRTGNAILASNDEDGPLANLDRLGKNIGRVADGVGALRGGLEKATYGAGLLADGSGRAEEGAIAIAEGLGEGSEGLDEAIAGIDQLAAGSKELSKGIERASLGALQVKFASHDLYVTLNANGFPKARRLQRSLDREVESALPQPAGQRADDRRPAEGRRRTAGSDDHRQVRPALRPGAGRGAPGAGRRRPAGGRTRVAAAAARIRG